MNNYFYFIILTVLLNAISQILIKKGMNNIGIIKISLESFYKSIFIIFLNPFVLVGLTCMVLSMFTHLISLSKYELSFAFPFISLSYIIIFLVGYYFFNENINLTRIIAMLMIISGIMFLAKS